MESLGLSPLMLLLSSGTIFTLLVLMSVTKPQNFLIRLLKVISWIVGSILAILILIIILVRVPYIQNVIVSKVEKQLENTLGSELSIEHVYVNFPKSIEVTSFYIEDLKGDTLVYLKSLDVDTDLWQLTHRKIELNQIRLEGFKGRLIREIDSSQFNYQFILDNFSGDTTTQQKSGAPWELGIEQVSIHNLDFKMNDQLSELYLDANWSKLNVTLNEFDLDLMNFNVHSIELQNGDIYFQSPDSTTSNTTSVKNNTTLKLGLDELHVQNTQLHFIDDELNILSKIGELEVAINQLNLESQNFSFNEVLLDDSEIIFKKMSSGNTIENIKSRTNPSTWQVSTDEIKFSNNRLRVVVDSANESSASFNPQNFTIDKLNANILNVSATPKEFGAEIDELEFLTDQKEISLEAEINQSKDLLNVSYLDLGIDNTVIRLNANSSLNVLNPILGPNTQIELNIEPTTIFTRDLRYFIPQLPDSLLPQQLKIESSLFGNFSSLKVENFKLNTQSTNLFLEGLLSNLANPDSLQYSLDTLYVASNKREIIPFMPAALTKTITLPDSVVLQSQGKGSLSGFRGNINLKSSLGNISMANLSVAIKDSLPHYKGSFYTSSFNLGTLIRQKDMLDSLAFSLDIDGSGNNLESMNNTIDGYFKNISFNNYYYDSLAINTQISKSLVTTNFRLIDDNAQFNIKGEVDINPDLHQNRLSLKLGHANLLALNFSRLPLKIKGNLNTNFTTEDFKRFNGELAIRKFEANNEIDVYKVDSLLAASIDQEGKTEINIDSDLLEGRFKGNVDLFTLSTAIENHINQYYNLTYVENDTVNEMNFNLDFDIKKTDLITEILVPQITEFRPGRLHAEFNSMEDKLKVDLSLFKLTYNDITLDTFLLTSNSNQGKLNAGLTVGKISTGNIAIHDLNLTNTFSENLIASKLTINDSTGRQRYKIETDILSKDSSYQLTLDESELILNYEQWNVYQNRPLSLNNYYNSTSTTLKINKADEILSIKTNPDDSAMHVIFDKFMLNTFSNALTKEEQLTSGKLNGQLDFEFINGLGVGADLTVNDLKVLGASWGDLKLHSEKVSNKTYSAELSITSPRNDVDIFSTYNLNILDSLELRLNLSKFQLSTLEPLVKEQLQNISGNLRVDATLKNGLNSPDINGMLRFEEVTFKPVALNNQLSIPNERIIFNNSDLIISEFTIKDQNENRATINGGMELVDFSFYKFALQLRTQDFLILNTTAEDNELFYGKLITDGLVDINGTSARPDLTMQLSLANESNLTYVVPETEYNTMSTDNIVRFINTNEEELDIKKPDEILEDSIGFQGLNLSTTLEIDKNAKFNVVIDPVTQDQLSVQGSANLNLDINRRGDIKMNGRYTVESGSYDFSFYELVKRKFNIEKGSTITWTGDPFSARMDIRAFNRVEAAPIDLMISQVSSTNSAELNRYKQRLPFLVYLNIDGELLKPDISFELDMPNDQQNAFGGSVYARIVDLNSRESDLNKQVFALLLLQRFISDNPLQSEGGYDVEDRARRSVSRILSDQLSRLTDNIEGVDIDLGVQSFQDYSTGTGEATTALELGVSKTLFDDKLEVKVAGNINIEGANQQGLSDYVGDLILEYKLTDDGRIRLTGFRRSDFDVISGEVIETGAGIIYVRDYNVFKELFKRKKRNE